MPIFGREGESLTTRIFGKNGVFTAGEGLQKLHRGETSIAGRLKQGLETPGGFVGGKSELGAVAGKFASNLNQSKSAANSAEEKSKPFAGPPKELAPAPTLDGATGDGDAAGKNRDAEARKVIGAGWDDSGDIIKSTGSSLDSSKKFISNLGKVRDQYLKANDAYKAKTDEAIAGNKTLIERNQKEELDDLARDTRKTVDNTNVMLGVKGASGGSAARAASRAIAESAGKTRADLLKARGDEFSTQNQEAENAMEQYNLRREQAYKWEEDSRKQALLEYEADKKAIDRLKGKVPEWKQQDLEAESDNRLRSLLATLSDISARAKTFRDALSAKMTEFGGSASELENAAVNVDAPAELQTPDFSETIDLTNPEGGEDFFDPKKTGKRVIKGYDSFGNPIYEDELAAAVA